MRKHHRSRRTTIKSAMRLLFRVAHCSLVLTFSALLVYSVYYAFALLLEDRRTRFSPLPGEDVAPRKPSPQQIVRPYNTAESSESEYEMLIDARLLR